MAKEKTLGDVSKELKSQNEILEESLGNQERLLMALIDQGKKRDTLDNLEAEREGDKQDKSLDKLESKRENTSKAKGGDGGILSGLTGAGLVGGASALASGLVKRGIPAALMVMAADEVADYVESKTGSKEVGDAVERGMVAGGIGLLFGKKIGVISGIIGTLLTEDNVKKLEEIGNNLKPYVEELTGVSLPSAEEMLGKVSNTFGNALTGVNQLITGDFEGLTKNLDDMALSAAGLYAVMSPKGALSMAVKGVTAPLKAAAGAAGAIKTASTATKAAAGAATVSTVNGRQVVKSKAGNLTYAGADGKATTDMVSKKDAAKMKTTGVDVGKFPRLGKFLKLVKGGGPLAAIIGAGEIGYILSQPGSIDNKVDAIGGAIGGALGGLSGSALGAMAGMVGGPFGAFAGGALGGIAGALGGDTIGMAVAQYLFGKKVDAFGFGFGWVNDLINGQTGNTESPEPPITVPKDGGNPGGMTLSSVPAVSKPVPTTGSTVSEASSAATAAPVNNVVTDNSSNTTIGQSSTALVGSGTSTFDTNNPILQRAMSGMGVV